MELTSETNYNERFTKSLRYAAVLLLFISPAIYTGLRNYLIFHSLVEFFCIAIAFTAFTVALSTYDVSTDNYLTFLGIAYGFIAVVDLMHTLAFKGMGVFPQGDANLPTQLWIAGRYMESLSLLISFKMLSKSVKSRNIFLVFTAISTLILLSIFSFNIFPDCFLDGSGLTTFKIVSEYIIIGILIASMVLLSFNKERFQGSIYNFMALSIIFTMLSEFSFTLYIDVYDILNMAGHIFKFISFYYIYKAIIETNLKSPYRLLSQFSKELLLKNSRLQSVNAELTKEMAERKSVEKALLKNEEIDRLKTEFFANISHDLRTPLNVILAAQQVLELNVKNNSTPIDIQDMAKHMKTTKQNCYRLLRLINNLIDITRIESGYLELQKQNCNIVSVVEDITLSVADYVENKGIRLIFDTDVEEKTMACDPFKIERIILNLLSNAIKFSNPGSSITVTIYDGDEDITISVKDTGAGIPINRLGVIFERFKQAGTLIAKENEGSGIGLSLVKSLVEMHGGTITVKSELGQGSEFIVKLPVHVLPGEDLGDCTANYLAPRHIEVINIEFSDIYS